MGNKEWVQRWGRTERYARGQWHSHILLVSLRYLSLCSVWGRPRLGEYHRKRGYRALQVRAESDRCDVKDYRLFQQDTTTQRFGQELAERSAKLLSGSINRMRNGYGFRFNLSTSSSEQFRVDRGQGKRKSQCLAKGYVYCEIAVGVFE
jgi:hypothetical protein